MSGYVQPSHGSPSQENRKGWPGSPLDASKGVFELTHGSACIIWWHYRLLDILISPYIAQFMGCAIVRISYGLKVVFCFRHLTAYYHHKATYGVERVQLDQFSLGDWKDISKARVIVIIKSEVSTLTFTIFSVFVCLICFYIIFCDLLHIHSGKTAILFSLLLRGLW